MKGYANNSKLWKGDGKESCFTFKLPGSAGTVDIVLYEFPTETDISTWNFDDLSAADHFVGIFESIFRSIDMRKKYVVFPMGPFMHLKELVGPVCSLLVNHAAHLKLWLLSCGGGRSNHIRAAFLKPHLVKALTDAMVRAGGEAFNLAPWGHLPKHAAPTMLPGTHGRNGGEAWHQHDQKGVQQKRVDTDSSKLPSSMQAGNDDRELLQHSAAAVSKTQPMPSYDPALVSPDITVRVVLGDITKERVDAIVNSVGPSMNTDASGPLAKALGEAAGGKYKDECKRGRIDPHTGELPRIFVVLCLGFPAFFPRYILPRTVLTQHSIPLSTVVNVCGLYI